MSNCDFSKRKDIKSLEGLGIPRVCKGDFSAHNCDLRSLEGAPEKVNGWFNVHSNPHLQNLKGGPKEVDNDYYAYSCDLRSLEGAPEKINRMFTVSSNPHLQSLKGGPKEVGEDYLAHSCDLRSLEGAPSRVGGSFEVQNNPKLTIDGILGQKDFQNFFKSIKNYRKIEADPEIQDFLEFLKKFSKKGKMSIPAEKVKLLWKTSKSLK